RPRAGNALRRLTANGHHHGAAHGPEQWLRPRRFWRRLPRRRLPPVTTFLLLLKKLGPAPVRPGRAFLFCGAANSAADARICRSPQPEVFFALKINAQLPFRPALLEPSAVTSSPGDPKCPAPPETIPPTTTSSPSRASASPPPTSFILSKIRSSS